MEDKIKDGLLLLNYSVFTAILILTSIMGINTVISYIAFCLFFITYTIRKFFFSSNSENLIVGLVLIYVNITLLILISCSSKSILSLFMFLFLIDEIVINYFKWKKVSALMSLYASFIVSTIFIYYKDLRTITIIVLISIPIFLVALILYSLIAILITKNKQIEDSLREITLREVEKDDLLEKLNKAYKELESLTIKNERNKIAGEIHDSVGHNLTASITQLEAAKRWLDKDVNKGIERINIAQNQVREGLNEIRRAVRVMNTKDGKMFGKNYLEEIILEIKRNCDINIRYYIEEDVKLKKEIYDFLVRTLKEGITNGIKHGKANAFVFKLYIKDSYFNFTLENNGQGTEDIKMGFGLSQITGRVKEFGGSSSFYSNEEGFLVKIKLPKEVCIYKLKDGIDD